MMTINQMFMLISLTVCAPGGYMEYQGYDITPAQALIPRLQRLLHAFRSAGFPVYHTREGRKIQHSGIL